MRKEYLELIENIEDCENIGILFLILDVLEARVNEIFAEMKCGDRIDVSNAKKGDIIDDPNIKNVYYKLVEIYSKLHVSLGSIRHGSIDTNKKLDRLIQLLEKSSIVSENAEIQKKKTKSLADTTKRVAYNVTGIKVHPTTNDDTSQEFQQK